MEAIGLASGIGLAVIAVLTLALKALSAERRVSEREREIGDMKAEAATSNARATGLAAQLIDAAAQLKRAQEANDDLEDLLDDYASDASIDGSFDRLLAKRKARRAASGDGDGARVVHPDGDAERVHADRLLDPWAPGGGLHGAGDHRAEEVGEGADRKVRG